MSDCAKLVGKPMENKIAALFPGLPELVGQLFALTEFFQIIVNPAFITMGNIERGVERLANPKTFAEIVFLGNKTHIEEDFLEKTLVGFGGRENNERIIMEFVAPSGRFFEKQEGLGEKLLKIFFKIIPPGLMREAGEGRTRFRHRT